MIENVRGMLALALAAGAALALTGATPHRAAPRGAAAATSPFKSDPNNWNAVVHATDHDSYVLGNPDAKVKLTAYISYTCPHCAAFEKEAETPLRLAFIAGGKGSFEVRNFVRDPVDLTVALLTHCGPASKFFLNHAAFLGSQDAWIEPMKHVSPLQKARWSNPDTTTRGRYIAADFKFYDIMETRGYSHAEVDKCLANGALAKRLADGTQYAVDHYGVEGTPGFLINDSYLTGTFNWDTLRPQLDARMD